MADPAVVTIFKARLAAQLPAVPLIATLNIRPTPPVPVPFLTLKHDFAPVSRITIGPSPNSQFREEGTLIVAVATNSGGGEEDAQTVAEQVRAAFFNYFYNHFRVTTVDSAIPGLPDEGNYFQLDVPVHYQFDFFR